MKKYFIKLKTGESLKLIDCLKQYLKFDNDFALKLITDGSVWVNSKRNKNPQLLITTELIYIYKPDLPIPEYTLPDNLIIFEDDFFVIVYKEGGVDTVPNPFSDKNCLMWGVEKYLRKNGLDYSVSPINRLDKPTKGLVFFAKTKEMESKLHNLFRDRKIKKLYLAITPKFDLNKNEMLIKDDLEWKGKVQEAVSYIKFIKEKESLFYFQVLPLTGRTHQIRKHFKSYLTPIKGDAMYGNYSTIDELELICFYYRFYHPVTKKRMEISYLPEKYKC